MATTLIRYSDAFTTLGEDKHEGSHSFALAPTADGGVVVYCDCCDQDETKPTHCCPHAREVCEECQKADWWLDICAAYWEARYDY